MRMLQDMKVFLLSGLLLLLFGAIHSGVQAQAMVNCAASNAVPQVECQALVDLYNATDGDNWLYNTNWLTIGGGIDVCDWSGVVCSASDYVLFLNLNFNQLSGTIPVSLADLSDLSSLNFHGNQLTGAIPSELGNLSKLRTLGLSSNQLSGFIPAALGELSNLQYLYLSSNQLTGAIPPALGNLSKLRTLELNSNQLGDTIPASLGGLAVLLYLYLSNNQLVGAIPPELADLPFLLDLDLSHNQLSGALPSSFGNSFIGPLYFNNTTVCVPNNAAMLNWVSNALYDPAFGTGLVCGLDGGAISGTVTDTSENPLSGIYVSVFQMPGAGNDGDDPILLDTVVTNAGGQYEMGNLGQGIDFYLRFSDPSSTFLTEYYDNSLLLSGFNPSTPVTVTLGSTTANIDAVLGDISPIAPLADVSSGSGSATNNPNNGLTLVNMPFSDVSNVSVTFSATCSDGSAPTAVYLDVTASDTVTPYAMSNVSGSEYTATIPAVTIVDDTALEVRVVCSSGSETTSIGTINLYDPSGTITDSVTGQLVQGARVTLYYVPEWYPKISPTDSRSNTCESNMSKSPGAAWSQPAPTNLGLVAPTLRDISPQITSQTTGSDGYYGWDVALGCWYVTVSAQGYQTLTSPVVGVPPEVTDLNLILAPSITTAVSIQAVSTIDNAAGWKQFALLLSGMTVLLLSRQVLKKHQLQAMVYRQ